MATIGCDKLHYCVMSSAIEETYSTAKPLKGVKEIDINAETKTGNNFFDDGLGETITRLGTITVTLDLADIDSEAQKELLGASIDEKGVLVFSKHDAAPYVALMFRSMLSDEVNYRYVTMYKGKFQIPQDTNKTSGDNVEFNGKKIVGTFMPLEKNGNWKAVIDSGAEAADEVIKTWFTKPYGA